MNTCDWFPSEALCSHSCRNVVSLLLESAKGPDNVTQAAKSSLDDFRKYSENNEIIYYDLIRTKFPFGRAQRARLKKIVTS